MANNNIQVNGTWFTVEYRNDTVIVSNRLEGRYTGTKVDTLSGSAVVFSHNGHRYMAAGAIDAFAKMYTKEINRA